MSTVDLLSVLCGYLLGSIPWAIVAGRWLRGIDIRQHGSGNAGASNVRRVLGWGPAVAVLAADVGKGALAVELARRLGADPTMVRLAGLAAILGHVWPLFARFRGGKGVATTAGVMLMLHPGALLIAAAVFVVAVAVSRRVSIGSMLAALTLPVVLAVRGHSAEEIGLAALVATIIVACHRSNLVNLWRGREPRL